MMTRTEYGPLPNLNVTDEELKTIIVKVICEYSTFDFLPFTKEIAKYVKKNRIGIDTNNHTVYTGGLSQRDSTKAREIIWDFIIDRYITPGGNGHDTWPTLTITERGKAYFESLQ